MTLAVIIAVLTGPSVVTCFNAEGGMGACLRDEMTQAGILPPAAPTSVETTAAAAAPPPVTAPAEPTTDVALAPAAVVVPPTQDTPDTVVAASFGLRVEPDGSVVIAGSGEPGSELEVFADDALIGEATVEPSGDWVLVPDAPLPTGGVEITLGEAGKPGRAPESFVVAIAEDRASEPLVVASAPGTASDVLQGLTPAEPTQLASADPVTPAVPAVSPASPPPAAAAPTATAPLATDPTVPAEPGAADGAPAVAASPPEPTVTPAPSAAPTPAPNAVAAANLAPIAAPEIEPEPVAVAAAESVPSTPSPTAATTTVPVSIDAIEIEGDRTFFAGAGPEGATTRLYVDDTFIADAIVSGGRWLVQAGRVLTEPSQRVRIDTLEPGSADVQSRAEVNFEVELPDVEPAPLAVAEVPPAPVPAANAQPAPITPIAPAASQPSEQAAAPPAGTTPVPPIATTPIQPNTTDVATPPTNADIPTMVAVSVGDPEAARFASGKAIIRTGDNLWTIARRVYGRGIEYTTIYRANTGQIRDPDRIYPGQVFELPTDATN